MKQKKTIYVLLTIIFIINSQKILCTKSTSLTTGATTKAFDRATGNLYLGLQAGGNYDQAIVVFPRYYGYGSPFFDQLVTETDPLIESKEIEFIALSTERCSKKPLILAVTKNDDTYKTQTAILAFSSNYKRDEKSASSGALNDANQEITGGIVAFASSKNFAFAAVKPTGDATEFGQSNSGLASIKITNNLNINGDISLLQTDAQNATYGIKRAKEIDPSIEELKIIEDPTITVSGAILCFDELLNRLYIGISQITTATTESVSPGARSIIVAQQKTDGSVTFEKIAPDDAFEDGNITQIVGARTNNSDYLTVGVQHLKVMHTSTGKSYLIINGGNASSSQTTLPNTNVTPGNTIFALPLVDNPTSEAIHGTLANYFDSSFTSAANLPEQTLKSNYVQAQVGAGFLPLLPGQNLSDMVVVGDTVFISTGTQTLDLNSEVGIFYSQAMFDEYGRIYRWTPWTKKAFPFNGSSTGRIKFFDVDASNGKIWAVDAITTETVLTTNWLARTGNTNSSAQTPTDLLGVLNKDFACGCFSYLDIDQSTMALGYPTSTRYALFGGVGQVAFVKVSDSLATNSPFDYDPATSIPYAQNVTLDFSAPENYLLTKLPSRAGCVKVLEYSRNSVGQAESQGYFFAGTQAGLYVFANNNNGFILDDTINDLNAAPFINSSWQKAPTISGSVIDIVSSGNALYVLTFETSSSNPIKNTLYKINYANTISAMFDSSNLKIIAQNGTKIANNTNSDLSNAKMFYATQIITTTGINNVTEQLLLATNNGIYRSNIFTSNGVCSANNQLEAAWAPVDTQDTTVYTNLFAPDNTNTDYLSTFSISAAQTIWPVQLADKNNCSTFEKSNIRQLSGSFSELMPTFNPENFNAKSFDCENCTNTNICCTSCGFTSCGCTSLGCTSCTNNNNCCNNCACSNNCNSINCTQTNLVDRNFSTLDPISYFWSDGARRFFIIKSTYNPAWINKLYIIPYDIKEWMITNPKTQVINDKALRNIKNYYWLGPIGATGIILAGTDSGIVALE